MRTPSWETSAGALAAFLNSATQCVVADLLTITRHLGAEGILDGVVADREGDE